MKDLIRFAVAGTLAVVASEEVTKRVPAATSAQNKRLAQFAGGALGVWAASKIVNLGNNKTAAAAA